MKCNFRTHGPKNLNPIEKSRWKDQNRGLVFWDGTEISMQVQSCSESSKFSPVTSYLLQGVQDGFGDILDLASFLEAGIHRIEREQCTKNEKPQ